MKIRPFDDEVVRLAEAAVSDKSTWGKGPWQDEPDRVEWRTSGVPCLIVRGPMGSLCGYAAAAPGHPWHGKDYDELSVEVHGGLNYAGVCNANICHVPRVGETDDVWWLGFDCGHAFDLCPGLLAEMRAILGPSTLSFMRDGTYRDIAYVRKQVKRLAWQIASALPGERS